MAFKRERRAAIVIVSLLITVALFAVAVSAQDASAAVDIEFERAPQLHQSGDLQGAIRAYQAILAAHPKRADVRSNLGAAYSGLGQYEAAIQQYKQALAIDPVNHPVRFNLAMAYYKAAWFNEAATELEKFITAAPASPQTANARIILADCQVKIGEYKKVIDVLTPVAQSDPSNRAVAYLLGAALISDGQLDKGQAIIDRVFRDDDSAEALSLI